MFAGICFESGPSLEAAIDVIGADKILYEAEYPAFAGVAPGPMSTVVKPRHYIEDALGHLEEAILHKILHDNAAALYHLN
jgi:predicted TIM-barrel fold metal-dependent hydrolase